MFARAVWASVAAVAALLAGCRTPLQLYIAEHDYEPFEIPRDSDGVGTVITFQNGREVTLARDDECLRDLAAEAQRSPRHVALANYQYTIHKDDRLELRLPEALQPGLRLEAAAGYERVRTIQIRLVEPFEMLASVKAIADALPELEGTCQTLVLGQGNFVISQVLGAAGIEYQFLDSSGTAVELDAALLDRIGAEARIKGRFEGSRTLSVDFPVYIGYRLLGADELPGVGQQYVCTPVPVAQIRDRKSDSAID